MGNRVRLLGVVSLFVLAGCGLGKRDDAQLAAEETIKRLSSSMERQSSVARSSGRVTEMRLKTLFPGGSLPAVDFAFEGASGLNRSFGMLSRPFESLAQMALRDKVSTLCKNSLATAKLFELKDGEQLLAGEAAPDDANEKLALAAARNAWLHPYLLADPAVQELVSLAKKASANQSAEGGAAGAKRAVCMAALLAPQFWMGNPSDDDAARRLSLELFRRMPKMQELKDYADGKFKIEEFFDKLQKDAAAHDGFIANVNQWHEEWLGFREFYESPAADKRGLPVEYTGGMSLAGVMNFSKTGRALSGFGSGEVSMSVASTGANTPAHSCETDAKEEFDPRTDFTLYDHRNYDFADKRDVVGFWTRDDADALTRLKGKLSSQTENYWGSLSTAMFNEACRVNLQAAQPVGQAVGGVGAVLDYDGKRWVRCNGYLSLVSQKGAENAAVVLERLQAKVVALTSELSQQLAGLQGVAPNCGAITIAADRTACNSLTAKVNSRATYFSDLRQLVLRIKFFNTSGRVVQGAQGTGFFGSTATVNPWAPVLLNADLLASLTTFIASVRGSQGTAFYETNLADMIRQRGLGLTGGETTARWDYPSGGLARYSLALVESENIRLPNHRLDQPTMVKGFAAGDRRVRRHAPGGWQRGWSSVRLYNTLGRVAVCNTVERFAATCFLRPKTSNNVAVGNPVGFRADPANVLYYDSFTGENHIESVARPIVLTSYRCGVPPADRDQYPFNPADPNALYPSGINPNGGLDALNDLAPGMVVAGGTGSDAVAVESAHHQELYTQLRQEPYKLIDHLVDEDGDFRELLTAKYTFGSQCLKHYYSTQGYFLPFRSPRADLACQPGMAIEKFTLDPAKDGMPMGPLMSSANAMQDSSGPRKLMLSKTNGGAVDPATFVFPVRPMSGIITMPAYISPVSNTSRGIAARYFARLLCDQPNFYDPSRDAQHAGAQTLHDGFISSRKHLRTECYSCHRNLDPLASALSWSYLGLLRPNPNIPGESLNDQGGEGTSEDFLGELHRFTSNRSSLVGVRHGGGPKSHGAFMGQPVEGLEDLGSKVANSRKFAECAVATTFQYVFGRPVQFADVKFFNHLVNGFIDPDGDNYRFKALLKSMITSDNYRRKN